MQSFSGSDILDLLKQFMKNCPESPPLGGSLDAIKEGMQEEDPHYDYAWDPGVFGVGMNIVMNVMNIIIAQRHSFGSICSLAELQGLIVWHPLQYRMESFISFVGLL